MMKDSIETTIKRVQHECDKMRALGIGNCTLPIESVEALIAAYKALKTEAAEWRTLTLDVFDAAVKANEERKE